MTGSTTIARPLKSDLQKVRILIGQIQILTIQANNAASLTRVPGIRITELDKALRIFCKVFEVTLLHTTGVET